MSQPLLAVSDLRMHLLTEAGAARAVDGLDFTIGRGETFVLLGESGCGKSMTALSILRLLPPAARFISGSIALDGVDLLRLPETALRDVRGRRIAMIFQEPQTSLNPVLSVGTQIGEVLRRHKGMRGGAERRRVIELLDAVGIPDPERRCGEYPHQLSGGMKQRVMIAMALAGEPDLLIADEPTTALDVTIQAQVLELLRELKRRTGMAILLITHDLGVVAEMADRVAVMYAGQIVEQTDRATFFRAPVHPYSLKLFESLPGMARRDAPLAVIRGSVPPLTQAFAGCRFESRCEHRWEICARVPPRWLRLAGAQAVRCHLHDPQYSATRPAAAAVAVEAGATEASAGTHGSARSLVVRNLKVHFPIEKGVFRRTVGYVYAVDGVSMDIRSGTTLALVGESGCGKTTAGKGILRLIEPTAGTVTFNGMELGRLRAAELRKARADIQFIFQDPYASMNPRMRVGDIVAEGMVAQGIGANRDERMRRVDELLLMVGLSPDFKARYPHEFSGGQRQRICIARALAVDPRLIICDEPTSALDVSVQAQILNLLKSLQDRLGLSYLFITHNVSVVEYLAHQVAVMYLGRIVEHGSVHDVLHNPKHPYTRALLSAVPQIDPATQREVIRLAGELPSPACPPTGCHFHPRCPQVMDHCRAAYPPATSLSATHRVNCHLYGSGEA
ncbi:MAG: ABC transporter ATP-binding protein [Chromatiales bacterium]